MQRLQILKSETFMCIYSTQKHSIVFFEVSFVSRNWPQTFFNLYQSNNHILNNTFTSTLFEIKIDIIFLFRIDQWFKHQTCQPQIMSSKLSRPFAYIYEIKFTNHNLYTKIEYASTIWLYTFYSSCYIS